MNRIIKYVFCLLLIAPYCYAGQPLKIDLQAMVVGYSGGFCLPYESTETSCSDGCDNDRDGNTDGADSDCTAGYDFMEDFDGSSACGDGSSNNCQYTYTIANSVINFQYTPATEGSYDLLLDHDGTGTHADLKYDFSPALSGTSHWYVHFELITWTGSLERAVIILKGNSGATNVFKAARNNTGRMIIYHGTVTDYTTTTFTTSDYHMWVDYSKDTGGGDGVADVYVSATGTKPGSPEVSISTGDGAYDPDQVFMLSYQDETDVRLVKIIEHSSTIGSSP